MGGVVVIRGAAQMFVPFVQDVPPDVCAVLFISAGYARRAFAPDVRAPDVRAVCSRRVSCRMTGCAGCSRIAPCVYFIMCMRSRRMFAPFVSRRMCAPFVLHVFNPNELNTDMMWF